MNSKKFLLIKFNFEIYVPDKRRVAYGKQFPDQ